MHPPHRVLRREPPLARRAPDALGAALGITSIPTVMAFRDGILLHQSAGALPKAQFDQLLDAVQDVDMDEVKAQVAARETSQG